MKTILPFILIISGCSTLPSPHRVEQYDILGLADESHKLCHFYMPATTAPLSTKEDGEVIFGVKLECYVVQQ